MVGPRVEWITDYEKIGRRTKYVREEQAREREWRAPSMPAAWRKIGLERKKKLLEDLLRVRKENLSPELIVKMAIKHRVPLESPTRLYHAIVGLN